MKIPDIASTCKYQFITKFNSLDGIYKLISIHTFDTAIASGINFITSIYEPVGLTKTEYEEDWISYTDNTVLTLQAVDSDITIYVPDSILEFYPNTTVSKYQNMCLAIRLGIFNTEDIDNIDFMINYLNDTASTVTGTTDACKLYSTETLWLTTEEYATIVNNRNDVIESLDIHTITIRKQLAEIERLKTLISYYEDTIVQLANGS